MKFEIVESVFQGGLYYHGSDIDTITDFELKKENEQNFQLLGAGVYFYKNKFMASLHGKFIYTSKIKKSDLKVLDNNYQITKSDIEGLLTQLGLSYHDVDKISGMTDIVWWFVDSWEYLEIPRVKIVNTLRKFFMVFHSFDGICIEYPGKGNVLCVWNERKFDKIKPIDIDIAETQSTK